MYTDEGSETEGLEGLNKEVEEWRFTRSLLELMLRQPDIGNFTTSSIGKFYNQSLKRTTIGQLYYYYPKKKPFPPPLLMWLY